jgi:hypothetical protein
MDLNETKMNKFGLRLCMIIICIYLGQAQVNARQQYQDTTALPDCIKELNRPSSTSIRSSLGRRTYWHNYVLKTGEKLYAFTTGGSIGCNINSPAGTEYYNSSCRQVAFFPGNFSVKLAFKPYIAAGYQPSDFKESTEGDYPLYFARQEQAAAEKVNTGHAFVPKDPFITEKTFKIGTMREPLLQFKTGDVIRISSKTGLRHYRNQKLLNNYKIIPQQTTIMIQPQCRVAPCPKIKTIRWVYYLGAASRFIDINNQMLHISADTYTTDHLPDKASQLPWKTAYLLN